jgi:hypothetical protein
MAKRSNAWALGLTVLIAAFGAGGCGPTPDDPVCVRLRETGLSSAKSTVIRQWIETVLADPTVLAKAGEENGPLHASDFATGTGPDWDALGINPDYGFVEFYGANVDYAKLDRSAVDAVIIGDGYGYKLIFKLDPDSDIEERLIEESKKPYGAIRTESLSSDVVLVCQVNGVG